MIKAVLFDFGGVLTEGGKAGSIARIFGKIYGIDPEDVQLEGLGYELLCGKISDEAFFAKLNQRHPDSANATEEAFNRYADVFTKAEPVYQLADRLRHCGITTAILSNVFHMSATKLRSENFYDGFLPVLLSCDIGTAKPELDSYRIALDALKLVPREILFIDDQEKCLEPARELGFHTLLAISPKQIVADTASIIQRENKIDISKQ